MSEDLRTKQWRVQTSFNGKVVETRDMWADSESQALRYELNRQVCRLETSAIEITEPQFKETPQ